MTAMAATREFYTVLGNTTYQSQKQKLELLRMYMYTKYIAGKLTYEVE